MKSPLHHPYPGVFQSCATAFALAVASSIPHASAATRNWTGTPADDARWDTPAFWGGTVPSSADDAWFNVAQGYTFVDANVAATGQQINVGRSTGSTLLDMTAAR